MEVIIRPVLENEVSKLQELALETFITAFSRFNREEDMQSYLYESLSLEAIKKQFENSESSFLFALIDNNPVGYLKINIGDAQTESELENALEIERIYVHEKYQGKKIGNELYYYALSFAQQNGIEWIWLGVWEHNTGAIKFYRRIGFEEFGRHTFRLGEDIQTDILMKLKVNN